MAKDFDLNLLRTLEALLIECNVTRAAALLNSSQPAVSAQLVRLRKMFDDPLLIPGSRGMTPTPRALELAPKLSELLDGFRSIVYPEEFELAQAQANILIGAADAVQIRLTCWIKDLATIAPGIRIGFMPTTRATFQDLESHMATGQMDVCIALSTMFSGRLHVRKLRDEHFVYAMRRDHPFKKNRLAEKDLDKLPHVLISPLGGDFSVTENASLHEMNLARKVAITVNSFLVAEHVLLDSDFVAVFPESMAREKTSTLRTYPLPRALPPLEIGMSWHERTHHSPVHRWVRKQIETVLG